ncbi:ABC transporter substrate-binding protein [Dactylosporangium sp. NPDC000244]|uniref:ABC transporter substrate-binding protein n=1 Tax=Dactylosporangium sp. NPDC000244 TaxID=3154365 RepID=UPI0033321A0C
MKFRSLIGLGALALAASMTLTACGSKDGSNASSGGDKPLVIGFAAPLTSGNAAVADQMVNTAKLAVKTINANGGAGGRQLTLKVYDDKLTADESAKVAQRAITVDKAEVMMGGYTSIEGLAIRKLVEPRKIVFINSSTISPALMDGAKYTFRTTVDQSDYPVQMIDLLKSLGYKHPVVTADNGPTGSTLWQPIVDQAKRAGLDPGETVHYTLGATDLTSAVSQLKSEHPDAVVHIGSAAADAGLMLKTMAEAGVTVPVVGFGSLIAPDALKIGGDAYTRLPAIYTLANQQPSKPEYQSFIKAYAAEYGGSADDLALGLAEQAGATWDAFTVLKKGLDASKGSTDGDELAKAIDGITPFTGAAGKAGALINFADGRDGFSKSLVAFQFVNGKPKELAQQP